MSAPYFQFQQFAVWHDRCAMKVGTDGVLLGAWVPVQGAECRVLDVGTGSGLIALMLAQRCPKAEITGIDILPEAVEQAAWNFEHSPWSMRLHAVQAAVQAYTVSPFEWVVSNPPYFINSLKNPSIGRAVARHTDTLSYADLLRAVSRLLAPDGQFACVLPFAEEEPFLSLAVQECLYVQRKLLVCPKPGVAPKRVLLQLGRTEAYVEVSQLVLAAEQGGRSADYTALTKDFYL